MKCCICNKEIEDKNIIALNKKLLGLKIKNFFCLNCLADFFEITTEELLEKIEEFKEQGCKMFN